MMHSKKSECYSPTHFGSVKGLYNFPNATDSFSTNCLMMEGCSSFYAVFFKHSGKDKRQYEWIRVFATTDLRRSFWDNHSTQNCQQSPEGHLNNRDN